MGTLRRRTAARDIRGRGARPVGLGAWLGACLAGALLLLQPPSAAWAAADCALREESITAALSTQTVEISARFSGAYVLLFGAIDCPADVVVVVRGPRERVVVRQKTRVAGIWVNGESLAFEDAPEFYAVAATKPLELLLPLSVRQPLGIGVEALDLAAESGTGLKAELFRDALIGVRQKQQLFTQRPVGIPLLGNRLFRGNLWFPATVRTGAYRIDVYYVRDRTVIGNQTLSLSVEKVGFESMVYDFAHRHPAGYGLTAILVTALGGLSIGAVLRKI